jgi:protein-tyrosine phosphatase
MPSILFVCTGNLHRSPIAEYLFRQKTGARPNWKIASAGTYTRDGLPAPPEVLTVLARYGIDARRHRTREVTRTLLENCDLILCMASNHKEALHAEFPDLAKRIHLLSEMAGETEDIEDPIGGPMAEFETAAREIDHYLTLGFNRIVQLAQTPGDGM